MRVVLFLLLTIVAINSSDAVDLSTDVPTSQEFCEKLKVSADALGWKTLNICKDLKWVSGGVSVGGQPLIYAEFGKRSAQNRTLILSMVHPDEVTPFYLGFMLADYLRTREKNWQDLYVVIAPLVNPDGWFQTTKTRTNQRGVDLNRNFDTKEWRESARSYWEKKEKKSLRRFPGDKPQSEPETLFQRELIELTKPNKILSIHAPLNVTDYDGPNHLTLDRFSKDYVKECLKFKEKTRSQSTGYFPGSLGNLTGHELGIPTITLELPSADARQADKYWRQFKEGIRGMIVYELPESPLKAKLKPQ